MRRQMLFAPFVLLLALLLVAGCTNEGERDGAKGDDTQSEEVVPVPDELDLAPEVITSFTCVADSQGGWAIGGELKNTRAARTTFRVTVFLGSGEGTGHVVDVGPVRPGKKEEFRFPRVKRKDPKATCRVQVVALED